jgi:hypothetical protein
LKDKENTFSLEISILPKFKKNEINWQQKNISIFLEKFASI